MEQKPTIRKQASDSVPYGEQISTRGGYVWCAYDGEKLVCVGATVKEARRKYERIWHAKWLEAGMRRHGM